MTAIGPGPVRFVFAVGGGFEATAPFGPAVGGDLLFDVGVVEEDGRVVAPGAPQEYLVAVIGAGDLAVEEKVAGVFGREMLALRGDHDAGARAGVQLAVFEDGLGIAEDVVDMAFDVAVVKVLARGFTGCGIGGAAAGEAVGVKGVLAADQADTVEDGAVGTHEQGHSLG